MTTVLIDSREQQPWVLPNVKTERVALSCGDYSVKGMENVFRLERKACKEIWSMVGNAQVRFLSQLDRLKCFPIRLLVVEGTVESIWLRPSYSSVSHENFAFRLMRWTVERGIPVWFMGARNSNSMHALSEMIQGIEHAYKYRRGYKTSFDFVSQLASQFDAERKEP